MGVGCKVARNERNRPPPLLQRFFSLLRSVALLEAPREDFRLLWLRLFEARVILLRPVTARDGPPPPPPALPPPPTRVILLRPVTAREGPPPTAVSLRLLEEEVEGPWERRVRESPLRLMALPALLGPAERLVRMLPPPAPVSFLPGVRPPVERFETAENFLLRLPGVRRPPERVVPPPKKPLPPLPPLPLLPFPPFLSFFF